MATYWPDPTLARLMAENSDLKAKLVLQAVFLQQHSAMNGDLQEKVAALEVLTSTLRRKGAQAGEWEKRAAEVSSRLRASEERSGGVSL